MFSTLPQSPTQQKGLFYEQLALRYLKKRKLKLLHKNYHCRSGEIDLIMQDHESIVFVEVRYREKTAFGDGLDSVTSHKQQKLIKTAQLYLTQQGLYDKVAARFDVCSICQPHGKPVINWVKNAFEI